MKIFYQIIASGCICLFLISVVYADTVVLKSGKTLDGKISEQANDYIKIDVDGTVLTYFNDEIDNISGATAASVEAAPEVVPVSVSEPVTALAQQPPLEPAQVVAPISIEKPAQTIASSPVEGSAPAPEPKVTVQPVEVIAPSPSPAAETKSSGFEIQAPQGWFASAVSIGASSNQNTNIRYTKEPEGKIGSIPQISVVMDSLPEGGAISTPCDFAKYILEKWEKVVEDKKGALNIIENPSPIEVNGITGCGLVAERKTASGKILKILDFKFIKNKTVISIQCMDWLENFDNSISDFEAAVNSFKFK